MTKKRDYISEIIEKRSRLLARADREKQYIRRVHPLVDGFRAIKSLKRAIKFRDEWLKYGAIGYIACVEGYFKMLFADLINLGLPFSENIKKFTDISFKIDSVVAIYSKQVNLGEFISHLLSIHSVSDINHHMSVIIDRDFLDFLYSEPTDVEFNPKPVKEVFPEIIPDLEDLFKLRHVFCHELAIKGKVPVRRIEKGMTAAALFMIYTEETMQRHYFKGNGNGDNLIK
ncbi:MAG: hypothetical protein AUJ60_09055 [Nitrospirae bacterium CG1_02_44_142]|nr:MAG: hypothetical protein AUJ60_09055 [Nitrospirae bacterium CG1_02_44_142]